MTRLVDLFETEPCGRCGGSGQFSYNQLDGTRCYGCSGVGVRFTKRSAPFVERYRATRKAGTERRGATLAVDDLIAVAGIWERVAEIEVCEPHTIKMSDGREVVVNVLSVTFASGLVRRFDPRSVLRRSMSEATKAELREIVREAIAAGAATSTDPQYRRPFYPHGEQRWQVDSRTGRGSTYCTFGGVDHRHYIDRAATRCAESAVRRAGREGCTCTAHDAPTAPSEAL